MDNKPLLQDRPPAYSPPAPGMYEHGQSNYGTMPGAPMAPAPAMYPPVYPPNAGTGYISPPQHTYPATYTIIQQPVSASTSVVVVGGCPACRVGVLEESFTCLGLLCAIVFFPIGILFCLALRQRRCPNCGATFG